MTEAVGGKLEAFYYAFGDADAYLIADLPDSVTTAAIRSPHEGGMIDLLDWIRREMGQRRTT